MNVVFIFTSSLFLLWVIRDLFYWLSVWQENDYRQDRFFAFLKKRSKKNNFFSTTFSAAKLLIFFAYGFVIFNDDLLVLYQYVIISLYLLQSFFLLQELYVNHFKKPAITLRSTLVIALTLVTALLIFAIPLTDRFFWLLFIDLIIPFVVGFYVILFVFPIEIYTDWQIEKAGQKIREHPKVQVIAVTGSVGKSLTKDYLATLLSQKYLVIKTEGKNNTAIGVAKTIIKKLDSNTEFFIAEISAYHQGEIGMLTRLIRAKIGVLTAITNQHLSLFKSLENIKKTNFELVESLPKQGFCLFSGDNQNTLSLYKKSKKTKVLYKTAKSSSLDSVGAHEIVAYGIVSKQRKKVCTIHFHNTSLQVVLHPTVHVERLLPAVYLALYFGMNEQEIKKGLALLR